MIKGYLYMFVVGERLNIKWKWKSDEREVEIDGLIS
jgi:hypothetical protein